MSRSRVSTHITCELSHTSLFYVYIYTLCVMLKLYSNRVLFAETCTSEHKQFPAKTKTDTNTDTIANIKARTQKPH